MKRFTIIGFRLLMVFVSITYLSSCSSELSEPKQLSEVTSVAEAKERINWDLSTLLKKYNELCSGPRNDTQKRKFLELAAEIGELYLSGVKCEKLDSNNQIEIFDFAMASLHSNKDFVTLLDSNRINCW
jgi:hypothetical protein